MLLRSKLNKTFARSCLIETIEARLKVLWQPECDPEGAQVDLTGRLKQYIYELSFWPAKILAPGITYCGFGLPDQQYHTHESYALIKNHNAACKYDTFKYAKSLNKKYVHILPIPFIKLVCQSLQ